MVIYIYKRLCVIDGGAVYLLCIYIHLYAPFSRSSAHFPTAHRDAILVFIGYIHHIYIYIHFRDHEWCVYAVVNEICTEFYISSP